MSKPVKASVGLVGDSSAGKSVALSLLYLTARNKSIDNPDKFTIGLDPATSQIFRATAGPMEKGRFPGATQKGQLSRIALELRYSTIPKVKIPPILAGKKSPTNPLFWKNISIRLNDIAGEEIKETLIAAADSRTTRELLEHIGTNEQIKEMLSNNAFIIILDGAKLSSRKKTVNLDYDTMTLITAMKKYREMVTKNSFRGLCFLITKWDVFAKQFADSTESTNVKELIKSEIPNTISILNELERNKIMDADHIPWLASRVDVKTDDNGKILETPVTDDDDNPLVTPDGEAIIAPEIKYPLNENYSSDTYEYILGWIESLESSFLDILRK